MSELDLNTTMTESAEIINDISPDSTRKLENAAYRAGKRTGRSDAEIASAIFHLASDGMNIDQTIAALDRDLHEYVDG